MKTPRLALAAVLTAAPLALSAPASHAADTPNIDACSGPVFTSGNNTGVDAESVQWDCTDGGSGHSAAVITFNSATEFFGTWYDNACSGDVHGNRVGSALVGRVDFVRCSGVTGDRQGQFTLTYAGLVGQMSIEYGTPAV